MNATMILLMALYVTIPLLAVGGLWYLLRLWLNTKRSYLTKKRVTKALRRHGALREWKVLENVTLGTGDQAATVDQLVVGPFGMLVACDVHQKGSIYGDLDAREWILTTGSEGNEKKSRIPSPYFAATRFVELLRP
ncbi:MAG: nuclease-related domain-containing protein, partial [Angelakisella sp.]